MVDGAYMLSFLNGFSLRHGNLNAKVHERDGGGDRRASANERTVTVRAARARCEWKTRGHGMSFDFKYIQLVLAS